MTRTILDPIEYCECKQGDGVLSLRHVWLVKQGYFLYFCSLSTTLLVSAEIEKKLAEGTWVILVGGVPKNRRIFSCFCNISILDLTIRLKNFWGRGPRTKYRALRDVNVMYKVLTVLLHSVSMYVRTQLKVKRAGIMCRRVCLFVSYIYYGLVFISWDGKGWQYGGSRV